jgi:hypothetical protein
MPAFGARIAYAFRCFFSLLFTGTIAPDILRALGVTRGGGASATPPRPAPSGTVAREAAPIAAAPLEDAGERAVQLLFLLQRDGRLVDFLQEDLSGYSDAQVGSAVRDVHAHCRQALQRYLPVEPVLADEEGARTTIGGAIDPASVRLVGNVGRQGGRGTVRHRGWRVGRIELPPLPDASARLVVAPAEVEVE